MSSFIVEYVLFVFVSAVGVIQIACSIGGLRGLLLFKSPLLARSFGAAFVAGAVIWYFTGDERNINDIDGGITANGQGLYFFTGAAFAVIATFLLSSAINFRMRSRYSQAKQGFDLLEETTYGWALLGSARHWTREWRTQIRTYFFG